MSQLGHLNIRPLNFRCNTPRQLTDIWTTERIGLNPPASAAWGDCFDDYAREKIVSQLPYKTAKEHYAALMAAAKARGGPTVYTKTTVPDWDGYYTRNTAADSGAEWFWGGITQVPTILSLLTPEYQKVFEKSLADQAAGGEGLFFDHAVRCMPGGMPLMTIAFTPLEFVESQEKILGRHYIPIHERVLRGEPVGEALIHEDVPVNVRRTSGL